MLHRAASERREVPEIIAEIFDYVERDPQPFVDCNHRTAMLVGRYVALSLGMNLRYSGPEGRKLREQWERMTRPELRSWVEAHLFPLEGP